MNEREKKPKEKVEFLSLKTLTQNHNLVTKYLYKKVKNT